MKHYYAVRYKGARDQPRIESADTPERAFHIAFGHAPRLVKGAQTNSEYKDLGTRVGVLRSDKKRIALLTEAVGWKEFL